MDAELQVFYDKGKQDYQYGRYTPPMGSLSDSGFFAASFVEESPTLEEQKKAYEEGWEAAAKKHLQPPK